MAKYYTRVKPQAKFEFADAARYLSNLEGAKDIFGTEEYKYFIKFSALFLRENKVYLDLSSLQHQKTKTWNYSLFNAMDFLREMNRDIYALSREILNDKEREQ